MLTVAQTKTIMKYTITFHTVIAIVGFLILSAVQFFLVYNTYELKNKQYLVEGRSYIEKAYAEAIHGELVFPGAAKIIDTAIYKNLPKMERLYRTDRRQYNQYAQHLCDSIFRELHLAQNMDSLFVVWKKQYNLKNELVYRLTVDKLEVVFGDNIYIPLYKVGARNAEDTIQVYKPGTEYTGIADSLQTNQGIWVAGSLKEAGEYNRVTTVSIGGIAARTFRIAFSLYLDTDNRRMTILKRMMPTFALSLISVLTVVLLFFVTLRNWIRQKKLSEMKSDFINSITHEFHTPLAAIIVANKTMQNEKVSITRDLVKPLTDVIQRQSDRLKTLISQVLDITTMNRVLLQKEAHSVHNLLDDILLDYRLKLSGAPVVLTLTKNAAKDNVQLDPFWFTTVLLNIFDNAIKYNRQELKEITVVTANDKKNLLISITDNGIGMTEETRKYLFEKFYRDSQMLSGQVKGLGLGLYYVKQAIEAHNWKIDIDSEEGSGSIFTITIPLA